MHSNSYTTADTDTFTVTHAWHIAAKVGTDLKRMQRFYGEPPDSEIKEYEKEVVALLSGGYLAAVTYGFQKGDRWIVALKYTTLYGGLLVADDGPGRIPIGVNVAGTSFCSFLEGTEKWHRLSEGERDQILNTYEVTIRRSFGKEPFASNGAYDKVYSARGRGLQRMSIGVPQ